MDYGPEVSFKKSIDFATVKNIMLLIIKPIILILITAILFIILLKLLFPNYVLTTAVYNQKVQNYNNRIDQERTKIIYDYLYMYNTPNGVGFASISSNKSQEIDVVYLPEEYSKGYSLSLYWQSSIFIYMFLLFITSFGEASTKNKELSKTQYIAISIYFLFGAIYFAFCIFPIGAYLYKLVA